MKATSSVSARFQLLLGALLFGLAAATFTLAHFPLGAWSLPVALGLASAKALIIILFFMNLLRHGGGSRVLMATTLILALCLGGLVLTDVGFRFQPTRPPGPIPIDLEPSPASQSIGPTDVSPPASETSRPDQGRQGD